MAKKEIAFKNGRISNFEGLVTLIGLGHTEYCHASLIDLYLHAKFHWNRRNFLWTDRGMHACTYGHLRLALLGRLCQRESTQKYERQQNVNSARRALVVISFTPDRACLRAWHFTGDGDMTRSSSRAVASGTEWRCVKTGACRRRRGRSRRVLQQFHVLRAKRTFKMLVHNSRWTWLYSPWAHILTRLAMFSMQYISQHVSPFLAVPQAAKTTTKHVCYIYSIYNSPLSGMQSTAISMSLCLSICSHISIPHVQTSWYFIYRACVNCRCGSVCLWWVQYCETPILCAHQIFVIWIESWN